MAIQTSANTRIFISEAANATAGTEAEFSALTYDLIGEVVSIGDFGSEFQEVTHTALSDRMVRKLKGSENAGTLALELGNDLSDAGQVTLRQALTQDADFAVKITLNDAPTGPSAVPTTYYFRGKVMSFKTSIGNADKVTGATVNISLTSRPVVVAAHA